MEAPPQKRDINELLTTGYFKTTRGKSPLQSSYIDQRSLIPRSLSRCPPPAQSKSKPKPSQTTASASPAFRGGRAEISGQRVLSFYNSLVRPPAAGYRRSEPDYTRGWCHQGRGCQITNTTLPRGEGYKPGKTIRVDSQVRYILSERNRGR